MAYQIAVGLIVGWLVVASLSFKLGFDPEGRIKNAKVIHLDLIHFHSKEFYLAGPPYSYNSQI